MALARERAMSDASLHAGDDGLGSSKNKQAVVIIHGIGEQRPMETLRSFISAVWTSDPDVWSMTEKLPVDRARSDIWSKPDNISESLELRRITTRQGRSGRRVDFFELYWAHLATGTKWLDVLKWARLLIVRRRSRVPPALVTAWLFIIVSLILWAFLALWVWSFNLKDPLGDIWTWLKGIFSDPSTIVQAPVIAALAAVALGIVTRWVQGILITHVGDAARYLRATPETVAMRATIRKAGIDLLKRLHDSGEYDRVVIVGHSLGTVIGYDILRSAWLAYEAQLPAGSKALAEMEGLLRDPSGSDFTERFRDAQAKLAAALSTHGSRWRVTDFVTLGSPLAHAEVLIADTRDELRRKKEEREYPTCPPTPESNKLLDSDQHSGPVISFPWPPSGPKRGKNVRLHHAAVFGPVRWTNVYFPVSGVIFGDVIGGPVRPVFNAGQNPRLGFVGGCAILDVSVNIGGGRGVLSHTKYWSSKALGNPLKFPFKEIQDKDASDHIRALRAALNLGEDPAREQALRQRVAKGNWT